MTNEKPSDEWPEGFQTLEALVEHMGTEWVRDAVSEIEQEVMREGP